MQAAVSCMPQRYAADLSAFSRSCSASQLVPTQSMSLQIFKGQFLVAGAADLRERPL